MYDKIHSRLPRHDEPLLRLGSTRFRGKVRNFGMYQADRLRHTWIVGKTGSGKSTLLLNLIAQDLANNRGVALLDPHGDLYARVLQHVPSHRSHQVALVSPADTEWPLSFNVFRVGRVQVEPPQIASQLLSTFKKQWGDSWGPRLEHILRHAILAVAEDPRATLLHLYRFLTNESLRTQVAGKLKDPVVRDFWTREFVSYGPRLQAEALSPVLNKVGAFIGNPMVRHIVGQERSRLDLPRLMDEGGIVLADLSTGRVGEDASRLLGGLLLASWQLSAMRRPPNARPFYIYIDEFQNFVTDALATMLAEARKFGIALVLAHQYLGQLPSTLATAVRGNVGTIIAFRLGAEDAETLAPEFAPTYNALDLAATPAHTAVIRLLVDGTQANPFLADMYAPPTSSSNSAAPASVTRASRERYTSKRSRVIELIDELLPNPAKFDASVGDVGKCR